jgi:hypothetical protein
MRFRRSRTTRRARTLLRPVPTIRGPAERPGVPFVAVDGTATGSAYRVLAVRLMRWRLDAMGLALLGVASRHRRAILAPRRGWLVRSKRSRGPFSGSLCCARNRQLIGCASDGGSPARQRPAGLARGWSWRWHGAGMAAIMAVFGMDTSWIRCRSRRRPELESLLGRLRGGKVGLRALVQVENGAEWRRK